MVPADAVQEVAPADLNCWVAPSFTETVFGSMVCAVTSVNAADADPPGPFAVTVTELEEGMEAGAVYRPAVLMVPADAAQDVAPEEVNCSVPPSFTLADVGEMTCGATNVTLNPAPHRLAGFIT